jgi:hypothetical protein
MNEKNDWYPFQNGETVGHSGSEDGAIVIDEEHPYGARITLERDCKTAPFSITCGIYGSMVHTAFFGDSSSAQGGYKQMKADLTALLVTPMDTDEDVEQFQTAMGRFVDGY